MQFRDEKRHACEESAVEGARTAGALRPTRASCATDERVVRSRRKRKKKKQKINWSGCGQTNRGQQIFEARNLASGNAQSRQRHGKQIWICLETWVGSGFASRPPRQHGTDCNSCRRPAAKSAFAILHSSSTPHGLGPRQPNRSIESIYFTHKLTRLNALAGSC